jgi:hypothetical protein
MMPKTYQSSKTKETPSQTRMHAFREPISCRGLDCEVQFLPKRKDQVFCSPGCRSEYFKIARGIGSILLERSKDDSRLNAIVDGLLDALKNPV